MTETLTKIVVNCETGEQETVVLTEEEIAEIETIRAKLEQEQAEELALQQEKEALKESANSKLKALGLTDEEIAAITK
jgi:hypothetical protein